jgi:hypothetical protein
MPVIEEALLSLLRSAADTEAALAGSADEQAERVRGRLRHSVVRPLRQAAAGAAGDGEPASSRVGGKARAAPSGQGLPVSLADAVRELARAATALRAQRPDVPELAEAAAALQDLAIGLEDDDLAPGLLGELAELQAGLGPGVQVMTDGPYLVTNAAGLSDWLGRPLPVRPQLALCRCGASKPAPVCKAS